MKIWFNIRNLVFFFIVATSFKDIIIYLNVKQNFQINYTPCDPNYL